MAKTALKLGRRHKPCPICNKRHAPWWNSHKGRWFLSLEKPEGGYRQINLGPEHDAALDKWHKFEAGIEMSAGRSIIQLEDATGENMLVGQLVGMFLENIQKRIHPDRFKITRRYLNDLVATMGGDTIGKMRVGGVDRVERWIAAHSTWQRSLRSVVSRVKQVFKWGADNGYIASSPIKALKRPKDNSRLALLTSDQVAAILKNSEPSFALAFRCLLATGCRPEEFTSLTKADVKEDIDGELYWWIKHKNQKHTGSNRRIFLTDEMQQITRDQMKRYPTGKLFRNASGTAWAPEYLNIIFRQVCQKAECVALNLNNSIMLKRRGKKGIKEFRQFEYVVYVTRHTFAHRLLTGYYKDLAGNPLILGYSEVAEFMGNSAREVEKTYGKLARATTVLAKRIKGVSLTNPSRSEKPSFDESEET